MPAPTMSSLIDRVNDANEPVGTVPRADVFRLQANFRTVHVLVFNSAGEVLLQRLSATRQRHPLAWGSSVAGYLHAGEGYATAARRRLKEELDLTTQIHEVGVTAMPDEGVTKFVGVFTTMSESAWNADPDHIDAIRFWPLDDVQRQLRSQPELFTASLRHVLNYWQHRHEDDSHHP
jgi:isopentenyldiphosphate isomerase